jgi:EAL and modified HD-GYP domain-containing signal transduction protein
VLEVVESVAADDEVIAGLERLRALGYLIAIDDFAPSRTRSR